MKSYPGLTVRARAPLRISFAGGGTEIPEFVSLHGGEVISSTISKFAHVTIAESMDRIIEFRALDIEENQKFLLESFLETEMSINGPLPLHEAVTRFFFEKYAIRPNLGFRVSSFCDVPEGSGLGSSSTLTVALLEAHCLFFGVRVSQREIAKDAVYIERVMLGFAGGLQDHYSATFGGLNLIEFLQSGETVVNQLRFSDFQKAEFESWLTLVHTGISRDSGKVIDQQKELIKAKSSKVIENLLEIKALVPQFQYLLMTGRYDELGIELHKGWERKRSIAEAISNPYLDSVYDFALTNGALGGKLLGAGGGGYFLFITAPENRVSLIKGLVSNWRQLSGETITLSDQGSLAWQVNSNK